MAFFVIFWNHDFLIWGSFKEKKADKHFPKLMGKMKVEIINSIERHAKKNRKNQDEHKQLLNPFLNLN